MMPERTTATGTMRNARCSELWSETMPMRGGEGTSPNRCIRKMEKATAVARSGGATGVTMAEFTGRQPANAHHKGGRPVAEASQRKRISRIAEDREKVLRVMQQVAIGAQRRRLGRRMGHRFRCVVHTARDFLHRQHQQSENQA